MAFVGSLEPLNDPLHLLLLISRKQPFICVQICFIMANGCIIMQLIVSSHANCVIESRLLKKYCPNCVDACRFVTTNFSKMKIHLQPMNVKGTCCLSTDDFECSDIYKCCS